MKSKGLVAGSVLALAFLVVGSPVSAQDQPVADADQMPSGWVGSYGPTFVFAGKLESANTFATTVPLTEIVESLEHRTAKSAREAPVSSIPVATGRSGKGSAIATSSSAVTV